VRTIGYPITDACPTQRGVPRSFRSRPIAILLSLLILAGSLLLAACSSETTPSNTEYPLTLTDSLGRTVQLDQIPERIVTTHPTATEILCCAGGLPVGCDATSKYPPDVVGLPTVGSAFYLSVESIAALEPDLIVIEALTQARYLSELGPLGVPVVAVRAACLDDIVDSLALVGQIIDKNEEAAASVATIKDRIEAAQEAYTSEKSVLILIADEQNKIYAARGDSYPGTIAGFLGLENLAADLPESGRPYAGFAELSGEQLISMNPDVFLTITPSPAAPKLSTLLPAMPVYQDKEAVKEGRLVELDSSLFLMAQGPRIALAVEELLEIMNSYA
jgi:iron complex transport system substrate-binding protein